MTELDMTAVVVVLQRLTNEVKRLRDEVQELKGQPKFAMAGGGTPITKAIIDALGIDHGSTTGLLDDDHTQYLPLTGIRAMTGALVLNSGVNILPDVTGTSNLGSSSKYFSQCRAYNIYGTYAQSNVFQAGATNSAMYARNIASGKISFATLNGGLSICAVLETVGAGLGEWQIPRAGDITMLANKVLSGLGDVRAPSLPVADPTDGLSKLWNNAGVVTVGT